MTKVPGKPHPLVLGALVRIHVIYGSNLGATNAND